MDTGAGWQSGQKRSLGSLNLRFLFLSAESSADSWLLRILYWETWKRQRNDPAQWNTAFHVSASTHHPSARKQMIRGDSSAAFPRVFPLLGLSLDLRRTLCFYFQALLFRHKSWPNSLKGYVTHLNQQITHQLLTVLSFTAFACLVSTVNFASCPKR